MGFYSLSSINTCVCILTWQLENFEDETRFNSLNLFEMIYRAEYHTCVCESVCEFVCVCESVCEFACVRVRLRVGVSF